MAGLLLDTLPLPAALAVIQVASGLCVVDGTLELWSPLLGEDQACEICAR